MWSTQCEILLLPRSLYFYLFSLALRQASFFLFRSKEKKRTFILPNLLGKDHTVPDHNVSLSRRT